MRKFSFIALLIVAMLAVTGCGNSNDTKNNNANSETGNVNDENNKDNQNNETEETGDALIELHQYEEKDDIDIEYVSINYDGSVVHYSEVDTSGEDEEVTPFFIYENEVINASSIGDYSNCYFYSIDEKNTTSFTGFCYDEEDSRVAVVYDITKNEITHATDTDNELTVLSDGRVLSVNKYDDEGIIYELTENGKEPFIEMDDMTSILGFNVDQNNEVFFIYGANDDYWNAFVYDIKHDEKPVLFKEVLDDDDATFVDGEISPDGQHIVYWYKGVSGGKHYSYMDNYLFDRESENEIHLGSDISPKMVYPNGLFFAENKDLGQVFYEVDSSRWLEVDEENRGFTKYMEERIQTDDEEEKIASSEIKKISGDGEMILTLTRYMDLDADDYYKFHTLKTEDYIQHLESQDAEIDFVPTEPTEDGL